MRARWAEAYAARARAHWTPERTDALLDGKDLPIKPGEGAVLLRALGLLDGDAHMPPDRARKYRQINHMVILLQGAVRALGPRARVLDAGCGRSYLSLLLAWCGKHVWEQRIEILGVDRNADVIEACRRQAELAELDDVATFAGGTLESSPEAFDAVLALHACDTATCDAIALGVTAKARLIAVAPCCQAELARAWAAGDAAGDFRAIWRIPHLRRETAAHITDAMRTLLLRAVGYETTAMEFVPTEHTKKNTLIRAVRTGSPDATALEEYAFLRRATGGAGLALESRLGQRACSRKVPSTVDTT